MNLGGPEHSPKLLRDEELFQRDVWRAPELRGAAAQAYKIFQDSAPEMFAVFYRVIVTPLMNDHTSTEGSAAFPGPRLGNSDRPDHVFYSTVSHAVARESGGSRYLAEVNPELFHVHLEAIPQHRMLYLAMGSVEDPRHPEEYARQCLAVRMSLAPILSDAMVHQYRIEWCARPA